MIEKFAHFFESLSILFWLHIGYRRQLENSKGKILFCVLFVLYYHLISIYGTNAFGEVLSVILVFIWAEIQFKEKMPNAIMRCIISLIGIGISQSISVVLIYPVGSLMMLSDYKKYIGACIINLSITIVFYLLSRKVRIKLPKPNIFIVGIVLYIVGVFAYIKYDYYNSKGLYGKLYIAHILLLIIFVIVVLKGQKTHYELEQKSLELDMKEKYEEVYNLLLLEMRRKQHDYMNQISALYSIQIVNDSEKELFDLQKEYGDKLMKSAKYDSLIVGCNNPVLSGYVYTQCNEAERLGVNIEPSIMCTKSNYNIGMHEVIEIMGILINNAVEYLTGRDWDYKTVKIEIFEKLDKLHIKVANVTDYMSYDRMEEMFSLGYSSKGNGRGLGLYSLKNIVRKNNGELLVENIVDLGVNWFSIKVII